jgi:hypothetical protein
VLSRVFCRGNWVALEGRGDLSRGRDPGADVGCESCKDGRTIAGIFEGGKWNGLSGGRSCEG